MVIDHRMVANSDQTDFPVLISGTFPYLATVSNGGGVRNANGFDVIFTSDVDGLNRLDHEIDSYDPSSGTASFWIRIPSLSHTVDTPIYVFYGNSGVVESQENKAGVWRNGYAGVWHVSGSATVSGADSLGQANGRLAGSPVPGVATGQIGNAASFSGGSDNSVVSYINLGTANLLPAGVGTVSGWVNIRTTAPAPSNNYIVAKGDDSAFGGTWGLNAYVCSATTVSVSFLYARGWAGSPCIPFSKGGWYYFTAVANANSTQQLYLNGTNVGSGTRATTAATASLPFTIGKQERGGYPYDVNGSVDEVHVSTATRSSDWILTEFNNQSSPSTFVSVGAEQVASIPPAIASIFPDNGPVGSTVTVSGSSFGSSQQSSTVTFNGVPASPTSWNDGAIVVAVPVGATTGPVQVTVIGAASNTQTFTVYTGYSNFYRNARAVVINHQQVANTDQTDFPVLISGTFPNLATVANGGGVRSNSGYDITFASDVSGLSILDHEIDSYDPVSGKASFWVRVPALSHTSDTVIYMFYGNAGITASQENKPGVWRNGYAGVWHLSNVGGASASDSLGVSNGTLQGSPVPSVVSGEIAGGGSFSGGSDNTNASYIDLATKNIWPSGVGTLSAWVNIRNTAPAPSNNYVIAKGADDPIGGSWGLNAYVCTSTTMSLSFLYGGGWVGSPCSTFAEGSWFYMTAVATSDSTQQLYINGANVGSGTRAVATANASFPFTIGKQTRSGYAYGVNGSVDEVRVSTVPRSADWITTEYNNQSAPASFAAVYNQRTADAPQPILLSASPMSIHIGETITIEGSGFGATQGNGSVQLNGLSIPIVTWGETEITATIPVGVTTGNLLISVEGFPTSSVPVTILPSVASVSPTLGVAGGSVTITGASFGATQGSSTISFNGAIATATNWGDKRIVATVPPDASTGPVSVTVNGITSTSALFRVVAMPTISLLTPNAAPAGKVITIDGTNFGAEQATSTVSFNGTLGTPTFWSDNRIVVPVPGNATTGPLVVTFEGALQSNAATFTFLKTPAVNNITPPEAIAGTQVSISGINFGSTQGSSTVTFNGIPGAPAFWSDSSILVNIPVGATPGDVVVTVQGVSSDPFYIIVDPTNTVAQVTDSLGSQSSYTSSPAGGRLQMLGDSSGPGCATCTTSGTHHVTYNSKGQFQSDTDALGHVTTYGYDDAGHLASVTQQSDSGSVTTAYTYNSLGQVLTVTDPLGNVTTNAYDAKGNLVSVTVPAPDGQTAASVTQFTYDNKGQLIQITDPLNHPTTVAYNSVGLVSSITDAQQHTTSYEYDARGNRAAVIDALNHRTAFAYDSGNRLTTITYPDQTTSSFGYDYRGRRTSVTDQNGHTTTYAYDDADRRISVTDAAQHTTQYSYDTENNLLSITDAKGHSTSFSYDASGRMTLTTFPSSLVESYLYDAIGNLTSKTDRKGQTITYIYDALNRLTRKSYPDSTAVDYVYDLVGKVTQVNDSSGSYGFSYDNMGRLIGTTTQYSFLPGVALTNQYGYDANSNRASFTAPDGGTNSYAYDTLNRLTDLTNSWAGHFGMAYDGLNRRTQLTKPNGVTTGYTYDPLSRLLSVVHNGASDGATYGYDNAGNRTSKQNLALGVTENYSYDELYQLTQALKGGPTGESYTYDAVGNRLSSSTSALLTYNTSNQLTVTGSASYVYDLNGNLTSKTEAQAATTYNWDYEDRLQSATLPSSGQGSAIVSFKYDPLGRRIQKSSPNGTTVYAYDGANTVAEYSSAGQIVAKYAQGVGIDEPLAMQRGGTVAYYNADALGSLTSLEDSAGNGLAAYSYDSFGATTANEIIFNPFRYTGREWDQEIGLYYYRARYYDPEVGRFISEDPIDFASDVNFYRYVSNRPADLIDPSGKKPKPPKPTASGNAAFYICCQGGDFGVCDGPHARPSSFNNPIYNRWKLNCEKEHELQHQEDFRSGKFSYAIDPPSCVGQSNNTPIGVYDAYQARVECPGYKRQLNCLMKMESLMGPEIKGVKDQLKHFNCDCGK